jgi:hypothetical protein
MFLDPQVNAYPTNSPDPFFTEWVDTFLNQSRFNVKAKYLEPMTLDAAGERSLSFNAASTDWVVFLVRVTAGHVKLLATCKDSDNTTNINGIFAAKGVPYWPGYIIWSTQRYVSGAKIVGIDDDSALECMILICEEDA